MEKTGKEETREQDIWGNEGFEKLLGIILNLEVHAKAQGWMHAQKGQEEKILALNSDRDLQAPCKQEGKAKTVLNCLAKHRSVQTQPVCKHASVGGGGELVPSF